MTSKFITYMVYGLNFVLGVYVIICLLNPIGSSYDEISIAGLPVYSLEHAKQFKESIQWRGGVISRNIGDSMLPAYSEDNMCICVKSNNYHDGDVATYYSVNLQNYVTHRIIGVYDDEFFFKGDNNQFEDYPVNRSNVICKVLACR